nr:hypothetical protein [Prevotella sp.]
MKKFLLSLAMAITAIGASAQNTYNVRAGGAVLNEYAAFTIMAQANISLNNYGTWTFSPAVQLATNVDETAAMLHANMGSRTRIGNNCLFVPKVGVAGGYFSLYDYDETFLVGPSIDLALELKHFVIGLTGFYSINKAMELYDYYEDECNIPMVSLTLGYTF